MSSAMLLRKGVISGLSCIGMIPIIMIIVPWVGRGLGLG